MGREYLESTLMSDQTDLISIAGLTVKFGGLTALDDVYLKVAPTSVVGLIGQMVRVRPQFLM